MDEVQVDGRTVCFEPVAEQRVDPDDVARTLARIITDGDYTRYLQRVMKRGPGFHTDPA